MSDEFEFPEEREQDTLRRNVSQRQFGGETSEAYFNRRKAHYEQTAKDNDFTLPPDKEAFYDALEQADEHRRKMKVMTPVERNEYMRGLRTGLQGDKGPPGDLDNPLKKDMPKEPVAPRQPKPPNPMTTVRKMRSLARMAKGRRR